MAALERTAEYEVEGGADAAPGPEPDPEREGAQLQGLRVNHEMGQVQLGEMGRQRLGPGVGPTWLGWVDGGSLPGWQGWRWLALVCSVLWQVHAPQERGLWAQLAGPCVRSLHPVCLAPALVRVLWRLLCCG